MSLAQFGQLLKCAALGWFENRASSRGAALAYYAVFSFAPLLILVIAIAGLVLGRQAVEGVVFDQLSYFIGADDAKLVQSTIISASDKTSGVLASAIGLVTLLIGGTAVLSELQSSLNEIWKSRGVSGSGIWRAVRGRLLSVALVFAMGTVFLASILVGGALTAFGGFLQGEAPGLPNILGIVHALLSFVIATAFFAMAFKILPDTRIGWRDVWLGALVSAVLFSGGRFLIGLYIGNQKVVSTYGAAGAPLVLLLWVYYSAQIFLFGAELAKAHGDLRTQEGAKGAMPPAADRRSGAAQ